MTRANAAGSAEFFGKWDPYKKWPRFMSGYSKAITIFVGGAFVVMGLLTLFGVLETT